MRTANPQRKDIVVDAIFEKNDKLDLITENSEILTVSKRLFEEKFDNIQEVPLPLQATIMEHDGAVVEFITVHQ